MIVRPLQNFSGNLTRLTLSSRFNWRGIGSKTDELISPGASTRSVSLSGAHVAAAVAMEGPVVVRHDGTQKRKGFSSVRSGLVRIGYTQASVRARLFEEAASSRRGLVCR